MSKSISIVIPAYNDAKEIEVTIENINKIARRLFDDYELLIFNDNSQDNTGLPDR